MKTKIAFLITCTLFTNTTHLQSIPPNKQEKWLSEMGPLTLSKISDLEYDFITTFFYFVSDPKVADKKEIELKQELFNLIQMASNPKLNKKQVLQRERNFILQLIYNESGMNPLLKIPVYYQIHKLSDNETNKIFRKLTLTTISSRTPLFPLWVKHQKIITEMQQTISASEKLFNQKEEDSL